MCDIVVECITEREGNNMKWRMYGIGLDDVIITADSFDEALAKAREINDNYIGGKRI